jgi:hypothetical protein
VSRCDRGDYTRVLPTHCTRGCGCNGHPAFPAPSVLGETFMQNSGASRRGNANAYLKLFGCLKTESVAFHSVRARRAPSCHHPRKRVTQYSEAVLMEAKGCGVLDTPLSRSMTADFVGVQARLCPPYGSSRHHPRKRMIQYSEVLVMEAKGHGVLDTPLSRSMTADARQYRIDLARQLLRPKSRDTPPAPACCWPTPCWSRA